MHHAITGLFPTSRGARRAVDELVERGVPERSISVIAADPNNPAGDKGVLDTPTTSEEDAGSSAVAAGTVAGFSAGFITIGVLGITGIGLLAVGPIAALAAAGGAAAGGLAGAADGLGIPHDKVDEYERRLEQGAVLVAVDAERIKRDLTAELLDRHGAELVEAM